MKTFTTAALALLLSASAGFALADDAMRSDGMSPDATAKARALQECPDHMATASTDGIRQDHAATRMDAICIDMNKREDLSRRSEAIPSPASLGSSAMQH